MEQPPGLQVVHLAEFDAVAIAETFERAAPPRSAEEDWEPVVREAIECILAAGGDPFY
jgi:hypothetical protein